MYRASLFSRFAKWAAYATGHPTSFALAVGTLCVWAITGPFYHFSDTWQLVINTGTTIITFLMVFLIQNTQNRDSAAMQLKLDELIRAVQGAHRQYAAVQAERPERRILFRAQRCALPDVIGVIADLP